jgi:inorganic pyrophosphatase
MSTDVIENAELPVGERHHAPADASDVPSDVPSDVVVVVEIPRGGRAKFEIEPETGTIWLDRVLSTSTRYPAEYGYVQHTIAGDGDPLDAVVLLEEATVPGCHIPARPIGVLEMTDEHGGDPKLLCVATGDPTMGDLCHAADVPHHVLEEIEHFFRVYKELEPRTHVETGGWRDAGAAAELVARCRASYRRHTIELAIEAASHPADPSASSPDEQDWRMDLHLEPDQAELLREVLDSTSRDLHYEIADTDNSTFKAKLRDRARALDELLGMVGGPLPNK